MDERMELSIICGTNEKLRRELDEAYRDVPNIHVYGFMTDINTAMSSADLYLTKPGGLSTTEAAMKDLPMVFVDTVAGCEEYNLRYFVELGGAVTAASGEELCRLCLELMGDECRRVRMKQALASQSHENAAQCICNTLHRDIEKEGA